MQYQDQEPEASPKVDTSHNQHNPSVRCNENEKSYHKDNLIFIRTRHIVPEKIIIINRTKREGFDQQMSI